MPLETRWATPLSQPQDGIRQLARAVPFLVLGTQACVFPSALGLDALLIIEIFHGHKRHRAIFSHPRIGGVAHYRQYPRTGVVPRKLTDRSECAQARLLYDILCIGTVAGEPPRQRQRIGQVRDDDALKASSVVFVLHVQYLKYDSAAGLFIPQKQTKRKSYGRECDCPALSRLVSAPRSS